jgi:rubrerythrin
MTEAELKAMTEDELKACRRCNVQMGRGVALLNQFVEADDTFGGTMSRIGPAEMVPVWKCPQCGHSVTMTVEPPESEEE